MKTTIELPDDLYRKVKLLSARRGATLKELLTEAIRSLLRTKPGTKHAHRLNYAEMPLLKGRRKAPAGKELTPEHVHDALYGTGE
ncbi:MAG: hypothetical protein JST98_01455 [Bacteroidetes bacterium]|nr:hypothetical protein [Bacteroidota bacterium]